MMFQEVERITQGFPCLGGLEMKFMSLFAELRNHETVLQVCFFFVLFFLLTHAGHVIMQKGFE